MSRISRVDGQVAALGAEGVELAQDLLASGSRASCRRPRRVARGAPSNWSRWPVQPLELLGDVGAVRGQGRLLLEPARVERRRRQRASGRAPAASRRGCARSPPGAPPRPAPSARRNAIRGARSAAIAAPSVVAHGDEGARRPRRARASTRRDLLGRERVLGASRRRRPGASRGGRATESCPSIGYFADERRRRATAAPRAAPRRRVTSCSAGARPLQAQRRPRPCPRWSVRARRPAPQRRLERGLGSPCVLTVRSRNRLFTLRTTISAGPVAGRPARARGRTPSCSAGVTGAAGGAAGAGSLSAKYCMSCSLR